MISDHWQGIGICEADYLVRDSHRSSARSSKELGIMIYKIKWKFRNIIKLNNSFLVMIHVDFQLLRRHLRRWGVKIEMKNHRFSRFNTVVSRVIWIIEKICLWYFSFTQAMVLPHFYDSEIKFFKGNFGGTLRLKKVNESKKQNFVFNNSLILT